MNFKTRFNVVFSLLCQVYFLIFSEDCLRKEARHESFCMPFDAAQCAVRLVVQIGES